MQFYPFSSRPAWPPEWDAQFRRNTARQLMRSSSVLLIGILVFQLFNLSYTLYYTKFQLDTLASRVYFFLYAVLALVTLLFLLALRYYGHRDRSDQVLLLQYGYSALFLLWSVSITVYDQRVSDQLYVYILVILAIAMLTLLPPQVAVPLFLSGQLLLMFELPVFQTAGNDNYGNFVNSAAFCGIAILISWYRYDSARRNFEHLQIIESKSQELLAKSEELDFVANHDSLTGLYNRRYLSAYLKQLILVCQRQPETTVGIFMIDVDNFKRYNDAFGHVMGDECLRRVSQAMELCCTTGRLFRYGGEEFLYADQAADRVERLSDMGETFRRAVEALKLPAAEPDRVVTISIGFASGRVLCEADWDRLLQASDQALYQAKANGKNSVCIPDAPN